MSVRPMDAKKTKWQIDYYPRGGKGKRERMTYVGKEAEALALEQDIRRLYGSVDAKNPRIEEMYLPWMGECEHLYRESTFIDVGKVFKNSLLKFFGPVFLSRVTSQHVVDYKKTRLNDGVKKRTINKELAYFAKFIEWAIPYCNLPPLKFKIKPFPKIKSPQTVILSIREIILIMLNLEEKYLPIFLLLYGCGLRKTEALKVKAEDIDLENNRIIVLGKGGAETVVPIISSQLREQLERLLKETPRGYLFVNERTDAPYTGIKKALQRAAKAAGIKKRMYHHLLRHSFATHGLNSGVAMRAMQELLRHAQITTTETYLHLTEDFFAKEGSKFEEFFTKALVACMAEGRKDDSFDYCI